VKKLEVIGNMDRFSNVIDNLYSQYNIPQTIPAPIYDIPKFLGYEIYDFKLTPENENVSGAVLYKEKLILLNPNEIGLRRSFTLAHEIAHILLKHDDGNSQSVDTRKDIQDPIKGTKEYDANELAAELLMPEKEFRKAWKMHRSIAKLSEIFAVSMAAISVRILKLGIDYAKI